MKSPNLHLNLLHASERKSSSPVRLRVMLPVFAALACVGCLVWWGILAGQLMLVRAQSNTLRQDLAAKKAEHGGILSQKADERNLQAELGQLKMYENGRRTYGGLFDRLAGVMPEGMQLMALEIPEPPVQNLLPPGAKPGPKVKPLLGPTNTVEDVTLRITGRAENEKPVEAMMEALSSPTFADSLIAAQKEKDADVGAFRQVRSWTDTSSDGYNQDSLAFEIKYRCVERRFKK